MAKAQDTSNTSNTWQTTCTICKEIRRSNETAMLTLRCVFCWPPYSFHELWAEWFFQAFHECFSFQPKESKAPRVFGDHTEQIVYVRRDARIAVAAIKLALRGDHYPAIKRALLKIEERLERRTVYDRAPCHLEKLNFYREYRREVEALIADRLKPKEVEKEEVTTALGLTFEVAKPAKEKPLIRKIHKWKVTKTGQMGFLDVFNAQLQSEWAERFYSVHLLWRAISPHPAWKALCESASMPGAETVGGYDVNPVATVNQ